MCHSPVETALRITGLLSAVLSVSVKSSHPDVSAPGTVGAAGSRRSPTILYYQTWPCYSKDGDSEMQMTTYCTLKKRSSIDKIGAVCCRRRCRSVPSPLQQVVLPPQPRLCPTG